MIDKVFIRQPYNYDPVAVSDACSFESVNPTLAQQNFKDEVDINNLVNKFLRTGELISVDSRAVYGDFLDSPTSYQEALDSIIQAQEAFGALPANVRSRFENDPLQLLEFLNNSDNFDEAVSLGLMTKKVEEQQPQQSTNLDEVKPSTVDLT